MKKPIVRKALVYCVRDGRLLVFRHIDFPWEKVGIQVPGGSIRADEEPAAAALRELTEETGTAAFVIEEYLGTALYDLSPYRAEIQSGISFAPDRRRTCRSAGRAKSVTTDGNRQPASNASGFRSRQAMCFRRGKARCFGGCDRAIAHDSLALEEGVMLWPVAPSTWKAPSTWDMPATPRCCSRACR